ncbi:MAG: hypothetical protein RSA89_03670, partial [Raoultibacter sp.]
MKALEYQLIVFAQLFNQGIGVGGLRRIAADCGGLRQVSSKGIVAVEYELRPIRHLDVFDFNA